MSFLHGSPLTVLLSLLFIIALKGQDPCTPNYILDNILQDSVILEPVSQGGLIEESSSYFYPRTFFSSTPVVLASLDNYQVDLLTELNYEINTTVSRVSVDFSFRAENMEWSILRIKFWLTSRLDLLVGSVVLQNIEPSSQKTQEIAIPEQFGSSFVDENIIQLNFISGIRAQSPTEQYQVDVANAGRTENDSRFLIRVSSSGDTSISRIKVTFAIFNFRESFFASGGGQVSYSPIQGAEFKKIHSSFSPIIYLLYGFDKIRFDASQNNDRFHLEFYFDEDYVMETYTDSVQFEELGVVYLSIGEQPVNVCDCDRFIQLDGCVEQCSALTYPFVDYAEGGKTCLTCSAKLNETINEFNTGCVCLDGFSRVDDQCVQTGPPIECTLENTVALNGACVCIAGTQLIDGLCQTRCGANEDFNQQSSQCECVFGYVLTNGVCQVCAADRVYSSEFKACICPQNEFVNATTNLCECIPTFNLFEGICVDDCPDGYTSQSRVCVPSLNCSVNQVESNGQCVCAEGFVQIGDECGTCPPTTYYNSTSQSCINCVANCNTCQNFSTCDDCQQGYIYNGTACVFNRTCTQANQTLSNGACTCISGTYRVNGQCTVCPDGTYHSPATQTCNSCVFNCLSCISGNACLNCIPGLVFNIQLGFCAPPDTLQCDSNQTQVDGQCVCIEGTYEIQGMCSVCPEGNFYDSVNQACFSCVQDCVECSGPTDCLTCRDFYFFNQTSSRCEPSNCPINETLVNGVCTCVEDTYKVNGVCSVCPIGQFINVTAQECRPCPTNCLRCGNAITCTLCEPNYKLVNNLCQYNLYDLVPGYPKFTQTNVLTDFQAYRTDIPSASPEQLQELVEIELQSGVPLPSETIITQSPSNSSRIRVVQSYCGSVPLSSYTAKYSFNDPSVNPNKTDVESIRYSLIDRGYTDLTQ